MRKPHSPADSAAEIAKEAKGAALREETQRYGDAGFS